MPRCAFWGALYHRSINSFKIIRLNHSRKEQRRKTNTRLPLPLTYRLWASNDLITVSFDNLQLNSIYGDYTLHYMLHAHKKNMSFLVFMLLMLSILFAIYIHTSCTATSYITEYHSGYMIACVIWIIYLENFRLYIELLMERHAWLAILLRRN